MTFALVSHNTIPPNVLGTGSVPVAFVPIRLPDRVLFEDRMTTPYAATPISVAGSAPLPLMTFAESAVFGPCRSIPEFSFRMAYVPSALVPM